MWHPKTSTTDRSRIAILAANAFSLLLCVAIGGALHADQPPKADMGPILTFFEEGNLYTVVRHNRQDSLALMRVIRRQQGDTGFPKEKESIYDIYDDPPAFYRWRITSTAFWASDGLSGFSYRELSFEDLDAICTVRRGKRLPEPENKRLNTTLNATPAQHWSLRPVWNAYYDLKFELENRTGKDATREVEHMVECDLVPTGKKSALSFHLIRNKMEVFRGDLKRLESEELYPDWTFIDSFPVGFQESFQAYLKGNTYYFVTKSGQVHVSFKPNQGKRTAERVKTEGNQAVTTVVTDVKSETTFAFSAPIQRDGKTAWGSLLRFEADKVVVLPYSAEAIPRIKEDPGPVKQSIEHAQYLLNGKFIRIR